RLLVGRHLRRELWLLLLTFLVAALGVLEPDEHADDDHEDEDAEHSPEPVDLFAFAAATSAPAAAPGLVRFQGRRPHRAVGPHLRFQAGQRIDDKHQRSPPRRTEFGRPRAGRAPMLAQTTDSSRPGRERARRPRTMLSEPDAPRRAASEAGCGRRAWARH